MLGWFILGITLLSGFVLLGRWFSTATPKDILLAAKIIGLVALVGLFILLALSGRLAWAAAMVPAAVAWVLRFYSVARLAQRGFTAARNWSRMNEGSPSGKVSTVETTFLHMSLNHDNGDMSGRVVKGIYEGRELTSLAETEMRSFWEECRAGDAESVQVLEAYLDRMHPGWRAEDETQDADTGGAAFKAGAMSHDEALKILGLAPKADEKAIKAAHRRLMAGLHPDRGGSDYLAAKINQAKDVLLDQS